MTTNQFQGGCTNCGYGTAAIISNSGSCPFCYHGRITVNRGEKALLQRITGKRVKGLIAPFTLNHPNPLHYKEVRRQLIDLARRTYPYTKQGLASLPQEWNTVRKLHYYVGDLTNDRIVRLLGTHPELADIEQRMTTSPTVSGSPTDISRSIRKMYPSKTGGLTDAAIAASEKKDHSIAYIHHSAAAKHNLQLADSEKDPNGPKAALLRKIALSHAIAADHHAKHMSDLHKAVIGLGPITEEAAKQGHQFGEIDYRPTETIPEDYYTL